MKRGHAEFSSLNRQIACPFVIYPSGILMDEMIKFAKVLYEESRPHG
jgi:hypothetical protein